jgi:hypothetical protein
VPVPNFTLIKALTDPLWFNYFLLWGAAIIAVVEQISSEIEQKFLGTDHRDRRVRRPAPTQNENNDPARLTFSPASARSLGLDFTDFTDQPAPAARPRKLCPDLAQSMRLRVTANFRGRTTLNRNSTLRCALTDMRDKSATRRSK